MCLILMVSSICPMMSRVVEFAVLHARGLWTNCLCCMVLTKSELMIVMADPVSTIASVGLSLARILM